MKNNRIGSFGISIIVLTIMIPFQVRAQVRIRAVISPELLPGQSAIFKLLQRLNLMTEQYLINPNNNLNLIAYEKLKLQ